MAERKRAFRPLLPSSPIALPFEGDYEGLSVQYDVDRMMSLSSRLSEIAGDWDGRAEDLRLQANARSGEFRSAWTAHETQRSLRARPPASGGVQFFEQSAEEYAQTDREYLLAMAQFSRDLDAIRQQQRQVNREINLLTIADCVVRVGEIVTRLEPDETTGKEKKVKFWTWPYEGEAPDPKNPSDWAAWSDEVLIWICTSGMEQARKLLRDPKSDER